MLSRQGKVIEDAADGSVAAREGSVARLRRPNA